MDTARLPRLHLAWSARSAGTLADTCACGATLACTLGMDPADRLTCEVRRHEHLQGVERPDIDDRYAREQGTILVKRLRMACWLALVLVPLFYVLDAILHPHLLLPFLFIRLAIMLGAVLGLLALRHQAGRGRAQALSFALMLQAGLGMVVMTGFDQGASSPYYAGINLVMLGAAVLMPWEVDLSLALVLTLIGAYAMTCLGWAGVARQQMFASNLFFLCATGLITVVSHRASAQSRRREVVQLVALEEAGRHRDEFLANITHELRTPLAAILGFTEMLNDYMTGATPEQRGWLARIHENAVTLYRLIVQLLDFSKADTGTLEVAQEPLNLAAIVTKVAADMRAIGGDEATIGLEIAPETPAALGDAARVEEIVSNLAANALKFSAGRPITLALGPAVDERHPPWQRIVPHPGPDTAGRRYVEIAVTDQGDGIRPEDLRRLFVAFQQLDGSSTRRHGGTGLGLAISARLAGAMQGKIAVHSTPACGSTFALQLPLATGEASSPPAPHAARQRDARSASRNAPSIGFGPSQIWR